MGTCIPCHQKPVPANLFIAPAACSTGSSAAARECITQTSSFIAPAVGGQASFKVAQISGFYSTGTYLHVFNHTGVAWVGRVVAIIEEDSIITLERVDFPGTVAASTDMGMTVCLINVGAVLPATGDNCHPFYAKVKTASTIPAANATGTLALEGCWDLQVGGGMFVAGVGWIRIQQLLTKTASETTFTYLVSQLLGTASVGGPVLQGALCFPDEPQVDESGEPVVPTASGTNGDMVLQFTGGAIGTRDWNSGTMTLDFVLPWTAELIIRWKVGQPVQLATRDWHAHWKMMLSGVSLGAPDNDADMSGYMASSNWGTSLTQRAAGNYTAKIEYHSASGTGAATSNQLDTYSIQITALRKTGVVGVVVA